jgi:glycosyltransferase involved in cell wall biosynthesis
VRVGINARLLASPDLRGFNRYTAELARALAATGRAEVVLFSDAPIHRRHGLDALPAVVGAVRPQLRWQHGWLPGALRAERIELFHAPAHWGVPWRSACPVVVTIHDLADRELPALRPQAGIAAAARHEGEQWLAVRRARRIIAVSEWTARSITRHLGVAPGRVAVTVEGAAPAFDVPPAPAQIVAVREASGLAGPYVVYAGGFDARKNLGALVAALAAMAEERRMMIALVGGGAEGEEAGRLRRDAARQGVQRWLRFTGAVDDLALAALYAGALAVVLPSWLEGFGLPVVEAMHVGTPAVVSSAGSLPEIAGDAGLVFAPEDPAMLAGALLRLAEDGALREALAAKARARAPLFTWKRAAEQTLDVYRAALGA